MTTTIVAEPPAPLPPRARGFKILRPLKIRDFSLLWWGLTVSLVGDGLFYVALPLQVLAIRNHPSALTGVLVAWTLPLVLLFLVGGVLSDRFERRAVLMVANALQGIGIGGIGLLAVGGAIELWHLYVLAALYGAGEALFGPAFGSIVPDIVPQDLLVEANSLDQFSRPFALRVVGPALGGVIIGVFGLGPAFLIDAGTFVFAGITFALMRVKRATVEPLPGDFKDQVKEGFRFIRSHRWLWGILVATSVGLFLFYGPWQVLVPFVVTNKLNGSEAGLATVFAVGGLGAISASLFIGQRDLPRRYLTTWFFVMSGGTLMLTGFGLATEIWHAAVTAFLMQALFTTGIIVWTTTMHRLVPSEVLGRVTGVDWLISTSLIPISIAVTAPLAVWLGADTTLMFAGAVGAVVLLAFMLLPGVRAPEAGKHLRHRSRSARTLNRK